MAFLYPFGYDLIRNDLESNLLHYYYHYPLPMNWPWPLKINHDFLQFILPFLFTSFSPIIRIFPIQWLFAIEICILILVNIIFRFNNFTNRLNLHAKKYPESNEWKIWISGVQNNYPSAVLPDQLTNQFVFVFGSINTNNGYNDNDNQSIFEIWMEK